MLQPLSTEAGLAMEVMEEVMVVDGRTVAAGTHLIFVLFHLPAKLGIGIFPHEFPARV